MLCLGSLLDPVHLVQPGLWHEVLTLLRACSVPGVRFVMRRWWLRCARHLLPGSLGLRGGFFKRVGLWLWLLRITMDLVPVLLCAFVCDASADVASFVLPLSSSGVLPQSGVQVST